MNEHETKIAHQINQDYIESLQRAATDPTNAATPAGDALSAEEASYLTVFTKTGCTESFVCRMPECLFFGMNDSMTWVEKFGSYHFKCPGCGEQYHPWADYKSSVKYQYVLGIVDPITGTTEFIPAIWPPSEEAGWLAKQVELIASKIETPQDVEHWNNKVKQDLHVLIGNQRIPSHFANHPWRDGIQWRLSGAWDYQPIKQRGYFVGAFLSKEEATKQPYSNWTELIGLIANCVAAARATLSRM